MVDTSIYGQIKPFTLDDPMASTAKAMQVQAGAMQLKKAHRDFTLEDDISGAMAESGGDLAKASQLLAQRGRGQAALQVREKAGVVAKGDLEQKLKVWEAVGSDAMMLDQTWRQALQAAGGDAAKAKAQIQPVYSQVVAKWAQMGHQLPGDFDPQQNFAGIGMAKENIQYLKTLAPDVVMQDTGGTIQPINRNPLAGPVGPLAGALPINKTAAPAAPTELARLQTELAAMAPGDPRRAQHERAIAGFKAGNGTEITNILPGPMAPGKTAAGKIDEDMLGVTRNLMQLDQIAGQMKPEYQRFQDKVGFAALKAKDSTVGLTNKEKADLADYSKYRRNAFNTLNEYIKSVTGAAMSETEADRIRKAMPDPGDGLFDGDSPTEFKAKLDDAIAATKKSVARLAYLKRKGMSLEDGLGKGISIDRMPALMNERGQEIEAELKKAQPNVSKDALGKAVRRQLGIEFGLSSD